MRSPAMRCGLLSGSMAVALVVGAACDHTAGESAVAGATAMSSAPAAIQTPVGPVPGPVANVVRRQNPYTDERGAMGEGRQLFVRFNCSGCHGGRAGGGMGPSLRDVDWMYGATEAQIFSSIAEGRAHGMPAWGTMLTEDQVWKLVAYVKSLRTPAEPDAPG